MRPFNRITLSVLAMVVLGAAQAAWGSSHSEAPGTAKDRLADDTDLYAWVASEAPGAVTIVGNWVPLLEPNGGPNFYSFDDEAHYYINIDNVGDCVDHIRYEFSFRTTRSNPNTFLYNTGPVSSFDDPDLNVRQLWSLTRIDNGRETVLATDRPVAPNYVGPTSMPNYNDLAQSTITVLDDGTKIFVGPRDDPFFVDLGAVFDLLTIRRIPGNAGGGVDGVGGFNVMSIVLQVPMTRLTRDGQAPNASNSVIGIYDSAERFANRHIKPDGGIILSGKEVQVSRLGMPLVNELVIPLKDKDTFNRTKPTGDAQFLSYVTDPELPKLFNAIYHLPIASTPRNDLVAVFLTGVPGLNKPANPNQVPCEMLRLNLAIPPSNDPDRLGVLAGDVAGFPNGRRLADDVVDIEERVAAGVLVQGFESPLASQLGDGVDANDLPFMPSFPYVAPPHSPFLHTHHPQQGLGSALGLGAPPSVGAPSGGTAGRGRLDSDLSLASRNPGASQVLELTIARPGHATLKIYDVAGREVRTLVDQDAAAGLFRARWDGLTNEGNAAGKGVFFARLMLDKRVVENKKIVLE